MSWTIPKELGGWGIPFRYHKTPNEIPRRLAALILTGQETKWSVSQYLEDKEVGGMAERAIQWLNDQRKDPEVGVPMSEIIPFAVGEAYFSTVTTYSHDKPRQELDTDGPGTERDEEQAIKDALAQNVVAKTVRSHYDLLKRRGKAISGIHPLSEKRIEEFVTLQEEVLYPYRVPSLPTVDPFGPDPEFIANLDLDSIAPLPKVELVEVDEEGERVRLFPSGVSFRKRQILSAEVTDNNQYYGYCDWCGADVNDDVYCRKCRAEGWVHRTDSDWSDSSSDSDNSDSECESTDGEFEDPDVQDCDDYLEPQQRQVKFEGPRLASSYDDRTFLTEVANILNIKANLHWDLSLLENNIENQMESPRVDTGNLESDPESDCDEAASPMDIIPTASMEGKLGVDEIKQIRNSLNTFQKKYVLDE
jgi:hypothetical protein